VLPLLDGSGSYDLRQLKGEVVVVNFFASWCIPCREEQRDLSATADAFVDSGATVVEIAYQDDAEAALAFLTETGASANAIYLADPGGMAAIAYGVFGIPETFFVSTDGIVVGKAIGPTDALVLGSTIDAVLAGEQPGQQVLGETFDSPSGAPRD
jgi:cytochrome c biogenesis protein CcmG/thiol:disulfide interchange protein DsbE